MRAALQPGDDAAARERIRTSLDESLIVEAAAGTGKTTELVHRVIAVLRQGRTTIERIVAVTFTRKAAGELKLRLRQELDEARNDSADAAERSNLENALEHLEEAHIGTIHGFCAEILRERPIEARVDPDFEELNELEAPRMFRGVFRLWMELALDRSYPGLQRALGRIAARDWDNRSPIEQLQDAAWKLVEWRDHPGEWRREPFALETEVDALVDKVRDLAAMALRCQRTTDNLKRALTPVVSLGTWIERAEDAGPRDHQMLEGLLIKLGSDLRRDLKKGSGMFAEDLPREAVVAARDRLLMALDAFKVDADADLAAALKNELAELIPLYQEAKRRAGKLDFLDLLIRVRDLVRDNAQVRNYLQKRFTHLFIDEFQDTDPLQADILILLAANDPAESEWTRVTPEPGKLFLVGDPKQSIYRFRRADVALYQGVASGLMERGVGLVRLTTSFRAVPEIQQVVNTAFTPEMTGQDGQAEYVPLRQSAEGVDTQPALIVLPVPKPYGRQRVSRASIEACLPDATAAFVEWLIRSSGWTVRDPEDPAARIPISPRHVCILFRRFLSFGDDMTRAYTRSLEARTIPHLLVGAKSLHRREEVETLRAALAALEWPDDELSVFATLKGSLFAIPDGLLLRFRKQVGSLHPFRRLPEDLAADFQPLAEALAILARLHRRRNRQPIVATVNALLEETRAHAGFALRPGGHQILANVYRVCDLARSFELSGGISFRGFVDELNAQAERAEAAEAPVLEEGAEGVRLMTVHSAKGLEFPVVILADMTANLTASQPDRHVAGDVAAMRLLGSTPRDVLDHRDEEDGRDRAEGVRIAYVAATRARDLLVIPAVGDEVVDGWLSPLNKAIYPPRERARHSSVAPGCEKFGDDTALSRPPDFSRVPDDSVKPGLHAIGDYGVVWWDPHRLRLDVEGKFGLRQEEILAEDHEGAADDSVRRYQEWRQSSDRLIRQGSEPRYHLFTATTATEMPPSWEPRAELQSVKRGKNRPAGIRFGTLVHTLLRDAPLDASRNTVASLAAVHSRVLGCPPLETRAALTAVTAALRHPLVRQAARAERCHREMPVLLKLDEGWVFEGVLDLAYLDQGEWTVLDFKTDAELSLDKYRIQLEWYVYTLQRITGHPARGCLLSV